MFRFTANAPGVREIARGQDMLEFVNGRVADALQEAHSLAPHVSGYYDAHLGSTPAEAREDGVHGELWSSDPFWHLVEFGSVNNPPHRVLERAITGAGLKFEDR